MVSALRHAPVTLVLAGINIAAWLVAAAQAGSLGEPYHGSSLAQEWTLWGPDVAAHPQTILLSGFMHLSAGHLLLNMVVLLLVGREVERALGSGLYVLSYLAGLCGAASAVLWMDYQTPTVGASGALFALMVLLIGVYRKRGASLVAPVVFVLANLAYTALGHGVSLWAHLGGAATGLLLLPLVFLLHPRR